MIFNTEDKNSDRFETLLYLINDEVQRTNRLLSALYYLIKDLAEYDGTSEGVRTEKTEEFMEADLARMVLRASEEDI